MKKLYLIWYVLIIHSLWGVCLLFSDIPLNITPIYSSMQFFGNKYLLILAYFICSGLACWSMLKLGRTIKGLLATLPQQFILGIGAFGAMAFIFGGHYADGVQRPVIFMFTDQFPFVILTILHMIAVIANAYGD